MPARRPLATARAGMRWPLKGQGELGDDELNFTEDEARCWASDPNNQPHDGGRFALGLAAVLMIVIAVLTIVWLANSPGPAVPASGEAVGRPFVP
jgi:hypothetical protein